MENNIETTVKKFVRNNIFGYLKKDISLFSIITELELKCENINKSIRLKESDLDLFSNICLGLVDINSDSVNNRMRYMFLYIINTKKQITNIRWIIINKQKFDFLSNYKMYNLALLREKLSKENSTNLNLPF